MNILLLAFAIPVATVLLAIVLQKVLKCPLLVAATFFAILLIVTYAAFDSSFLVFAILYTILAYVTAILTRLVCSIIERLNLNNNSCGQGKNCNVSTGTWCCRTRSLGTTGINPVSANALSNNGTTCTCGNGDTSGNDPVIILTNANDITNNGVQRNNGRNSGCNCSNRRN